MTHVRARALSAALACAATSASSAAWAQCDAGDGGNLVDFGTLRDSFPSDRGFNVPTDSPVRLRFVGSPPAGATLCVLSVGRPGCLPGVLSTVGDELVWSSPTPFDPGSGYRIDYADPLAGQITLQFRTGSGPSSGPPSFEGIRSASARSVAGDPCDPGAYDITVRFSRVAYDTALDTPWPESDVEYVIYETRGPGIAGPRERDRARLQSSGSSMDGLAQRTFRLAGQAAGGPVCFSVQAVDPLGRRSANTREQCVNPAQGNYFRGCAAAGGSRDGGAWRGLAVAALLVMAGRARRRGLIADRQRGSGSAQP